ncbi:MAG: hypothetical protein O6852_05175, partial [Gammaproteobacteria bacterium]|nr:hypothetical protein [Gammaproteobacteria bacterium]
ARSNRQVTRIELLSKALVAIQKRGQVSHLSLPLLCWLPKVPVASAADVTRILGLFIMVAPLSVLASVSTKGK